METWTLSHDHRAGLTLPQLVSEAAFGLIGIVERALGLFRRA